MNCFNRIQQGGRILEPIEKERVQAALERLAGQDVYLHLETTTGAYAAQNQPGAMAVGAFLRNGQVRYHRGTIAGEGPYRVGLQLAHGWVYGEGLTDFEIDAEGRLLLAGHNAAGQLAVALQLGTVPFPHSRPDRRVAIQEPVAAEGPRERHLMLVYPHPDDEAFGVAGTVAHFARQGTPVTYLCGTLGELGRNMGRPFFANRETLPSVREEELLEACRVMGITELRMMGLHDKTVEFESGDALAERIRAVLEEVQPSLLITFYPGLAIHPDHDAMGAAAVEAVARMAPDRRPVVWAAAITPDAVERLGEPDVVIDIADVAGVKRAALAAHRSQTEGILADWEQRMAHDPAFAKRWGRMYTQERFWTYKFEG